MADSRIPYHFAKSKGVLCSGVIDDVAQIIARDDADPLSLSEVRRVFGQRLQVRLAPAEEFERQLAQAYSRSDQQAAAVIEDVEQDYDLSRLAQELPEVEDLLESEDDAPIIKLINAILTQALREHASDVHIEPFETRSVVRFRIDTPQTPGAPGYDQATTLYYGAYGKKAALVTFITSPTDIEKVFPYAEASIQTMVLPQREAPDAVPATDAAAHAPPKDSKPAAPATPGVVAKKKKTDGKSAPARSTDKSRA